MLYEFSARSFRTGVDIKFNGEGSLKEAEAAYAKIVELASGEDFKKALDLIESLRSKGTN